MTTPGADAPAPCRAGAAAYGVAMVVPLGAFASMAALQAALARGAVPVLPVSGVPEIDRIATLQAAVLPVAVAVLFWPRRGAGRRFRRWGEIRATARRVRWLGIEEGQSWRSVALAFGPIVTVATAAAMAAEAGGLGALLPPLGALPFVLAFSATNALAEETFGRFHVVATLACRAPPGRICLISGAVFGVPHLAGTPGGPLGALMAGFLGWLLARAVLETRGLGIAWAIHAAQDVVIYGALLSAGGR